jgi:serine/threonine protein phosphatase 1
MMRGIHDFMRRIRVPVTGQRRKLFFDAAPDTIYAIGDVHGCDDILGRLEDLIFEDTSKHDGTKWLIMLGDYVDRGPKSASVLQRLMTAPRADIDRVCLAGNHESVMLDFLRNPSRTHRWLELGGLETLRSYGIPAVPDNRDALKGLLQAHIPAEHVAFLESLPSMLSVPGYCFVHAGLKDGVALAQQQDSDLLWLRPATVGKTAARNDFVTVHGHTPVSKVEIAPGRINIDTGAYMSGVLTALRLSRGRAPAVLQCR